MNLPKTRPQHRTLPPGFACGVGLDDGSIRDCPQVEDISASPNLIGAEILEAPRRVVGQDHKQFAK